MSYPQVAVMAILSGVGATLVFQLGYLIGYRHGSDNERWLAEKRAAAKGEK